LVITTLLEPLRDAAWKLEDFVAQVNRLLPTVLYGETGLSNNDHGDARQREDFSVRLLRHYASLGLLDEAAKVGREVRYGYRHLLQVLCLRRLQRQGWNSRAIAVFCQNDNAQLEAFLQPETERLEAMAAPRLEATAAPRIEAMAAPRIETFSEEAMPPPAPQSNQSTSLSKQGAVPHNSALEFLQQLRSRKATPAPIAQSQRWKRLEIAPGLELHILENLHLSAKERQRIQQLIQVALAQETER
jgi:DNA-binding transcriptional MerR regulator